MKTYEIYAKIDGSVKMRIEADTICESTKTDAPGVVFIGDTNMGLLFMAENMDYGVREKGEK